MTRFVYLFAFVAVVKVATALDCYTCDAVTCKQEMNKWQKVPNCGKTVSNPNNVGACLKQTYTDSTSNNEVTVRKCVIAEKSTDGKISYHCNDKEGKVSVCNVCVDDYCNSATSVSFSFVTLLGVVAALLIPKYL